MTEKIPKVDVTELENLVNALNSGKLIEALRHGNRHPELILPEQIDAAIRLGEQFEETAIHLNRYVGAYRQFNDSGRNCY